MPLRNLHTLIPDHRMLPTHLHSCTHRPMVHLMYEVQESMSPLPHTLPLLQAEDIYPLIFRNQSAPEDLQKPHQ